MTNYNTDKNISPKKKTQNSSEKQKSKNVASALTWSIRRAISKQSYFSCNSIYNNNSLFIKDSSVEDTYPEDLEVEDKYEVDLSRFLEKRKIRHNTEIEFNKWNKNKAAQQKCQLFHLTMHLNVLKDGNVDFVFPFSVWPLRSNKTLYNASDKELAARFNKSLNDALKLLKITPEYYYVITGEENLCDNNNRRHIHGCLRLPARFYDNKKSSATKCIYDI